MNMPFNKIQVNEFKKSDERFLSSGSSSNRKTRRQNNSTKGEYSPLRNGNKLIITTSEVNKSQTKYRLVIQRIRQLVFNGLQNIYKTKKIIHVVD